jgi:hypothetical protein
MVLSNQVDGVILVIQSGKSKWSAVRHLLYDFQKTRTNYLGSIINKVPKSNTFAVYEKYHREKVSPGWVNNLSSIINEKYHRERVSPGWVNNLSSAINEKYRQARGSSKVVDRLLSTENDEEFSSLDSEDEEQSSKL